MGQLVHWSIGLSVHWFIGPLVHWSICPLVHWSIGPLGHWSIGPLGHWSLSTLVHRSIGPLVHWLNISEYGLVVRLYISVAALHYMVVPNHTWCWLQECCLVVLTMLWYFVPLSCLFCIYIDIIILEDVDFGNKCLKDYPTSLNVKCKISKIKCQMPRVNKVKLLSERTSGA